MGIKTQSAVAALGNRFPKDTPFHPPAFQNKEEAEAAPLETKIELRISTDEQRLNGTERLWLGILRERGFHVRIHALTFNLAYRTSYTPEFLVIENGQFVIWEVKGGFIREDAWIKLKTAARMFPEFTFRMAQFEKKKWTETEVKP